MQTTCRTWHKVIIMLFSPRNSSFNYKECATGWTVSVSGCLPFCYWVLDIPLFIMDIKTLTDIWFLDIIYHCVGCLFIFFLMSFELQNYWWGSMYVFLWLFVLWHHIQDIIAKSKFIKDLPHVLFWILNCFNFYI